MQFQPHAHGLTSVVFAARALLTHFLYLQTYFGSHRTMRVHIAVDIPNFIEPQTMRKKEGAKR
jgi:hypothetical protein